MIDNEQKGDIILQKRDSVKLRITSCLFLQVP